MQLDELAMFDPNIPQRTKETKMKNRTLLRMVLILLFAIGFTSQSSALEPLAGDGLAPNDTLVIDESKHGSTGKSGAQQVSTYSITVVNMQKCCVDVYLDDNFMGSLPKRNTQLTIEGVPAGMHTL